MARREDQVSSGIRRLVLGFDAGCFTCSDFARRLEGQAGGKLEVRGLQDPQVGRWRRQALGEDAPWTPTLFEVQGAKVKAWTGWKIGLNLSRILGPVATWRILQILGEFGAPPGVEAPLASRPYSGLTRGQFLKGVGGAMIAMSFLASTDSATRRASADGWVHPLERVEYESKEPLQGEAKRKALRSAVSSHDVQNVWSDQSFPTSKVFAVRHELKGGNTLTAVSWQVAEDKVVVRYAAARPIGNYRSQAMLLTFVPGKEVVKSAESVNGKQRTSATPASNSLGVRARGCGCCRWRWGCVAVAGSTCAGCAATCAACVGTPAKWSCGACLACAIAGCPLSIRRCCRRPCG